MSKISFMHSLKGPTPIEALESAGQSVWLDAFDPEMLKNGKLKEWITAGVNGLTSNPALLAKKLTHSDAFDSYFKNSDQLNAETIYESIAIDSLRSVADLFHETYVKADFRDGYVSFEVSPRYANDTQKTIEEAKRLWAKFDRPNLMVKVPGTEAGLPAIRELIFSGINVNVTILFSVERYEKVAQAFIDGIEKRIQAGLPVDGVHSVASFFVSRIDTAIEKILGQECLGEVAVANAKLAYRAYLRMFQTKEWEKCRAVGAETQRLLWASTSVKSKSLKDVYYLEELVGPNTVTTVPPETLQAFEDHGTVRVSLTDDLQKAVHCIEDQLPEHHVELSEVTRQLETEAVELFKTPFEEMLASIEEKRIKFSRRTA